jgi:oxygen-independent coproporphyrinogen-3 oxidase
MPTKDRIIDNSDYVPEPNSGLALYIHIPFCASKCPYCDFNTYASIEALMPAYINALTKDIGRWGEVLGKPLVTSVFFGGGTPSYLPTRDMTRLIRAVYSCFDIDHCAEITFEANPGDTTRERLSTLAKVGYNRISLGIQSLQDQELQLLGRRHSSLQAKRAIVNARQAGFSNISLDLMFGLPNQFVATWEETLTEAIHLNPEHISLYCLTLESGTPMENDVRRGILPEPDPDIAAEMYLLAQHDLASVGYQQYEISNWSKNGHQSRHNLAYWLNKPYLGIGPGAHSYLFDNGLSTLKQLGSNGLRFSMIKSPSRYIKEMGDNEISKNEAISYQYLQSVRVTDQVEPISPSLAMAETMMMGLRLNCGVSNQEFTQRFGATIIEKYADVVEECMELTLLEWDQQHLRLTERGRLLGNEVFLRFIGANPT